MWIKNGKILPDTTFYSIPAPLYPPIEFTISNIGRYIAIKTPAMMIPMTTMSAGSRIEVSVVMAESTSAS